MSKEQDPFSSSPLLETEFVADALAKLSDGLGAREPFLLVTGDPGTGKTTLVRAAITRWGAAATVAFVADPAMSRNELLEEIVRRFGGTPPAGATKPQLIAALEAAVADAKVHGCVPVVVIDDAHELSAELLAELRLLANVSAQAGGPLEFLLAGLPALDERLADPAFEALRQRVAVHVTTQPFSAHQTRRYVHEIAVPNEDAASVLPKKICRAIHDLTGGMPRAIHLLVNESLRRADRAGEKSVSPEIVTEAAEALGFARAAGAPRPPSAVRRAAGVSAAGAPAAPPPPPREEVVKAIEHLDDDAPVTRPDAPQPEDMKPPGDPQKVSDWVGRFISPGEPRFGDLIGTGQMSTFVEEDCGTDAEPDAALPKKRRKVKLGRKVRRGYAEPKRPEWLGTVALLLVIAAALVVLAGPTKRAVMAGWNAVTSSVEASDEEATATPALAQASQPTSADTDEGADADQAQKSAAVTRGASEEPAPPARTSSEPERSARAAARHPSPVRVESAAVKPPDAPDSDPSQLWAVDVGSHVDPGAAGMDRERLVEETGLKGWIVRSSENGTTRYRVVLGIYSTRERAENGAAILMDRGTVSDAMAIPLPPRSVRQ